MADASGRDLGQFMRWYAQAGTPELTGPAPATTRPRQALTLEISQSTPATPGQPEKLPLHIPMRLGLLGPDGAARRSSSKARTSPRAPTASWS